jgi:hypothetical protein
MNRWFGLAFPAALALLSCLLTVRPVEAQETPGQTEPQPEPRTALQTEPRPAAVLGLIRPGDDGDAELRNVLTSSIAIKLARLGLQPIIEPASALGASAAGSETLFTLARRVEADYVLEGVYNNSSDEIEIQLVWYNANTRQAAVSVSERGKLGLNMDRLLSEALTQIFAQVEGELAGFSRTAVTGVLGPDPPGAPQAAPASLHGLPTTAGGPGRPNYTDPRVRPDPEPGRIVEPGESPGGEGKPRRKHLELSTAGTAFIATGEASEYFKIGYGSAVHLDLLFPAGAGTLGIGLYTGVNYFAATGVATSAQSLLIPMGVDVRYTTIDLVPFGLFVHAGGGPAMLVLSSDYWGGLTKLVPYALAGLGMNVRISPSMGTALDLSYGVYFEGSLLIMAFSPSVSLYFRF